MTSAAPTEYVNPLTVEAQFFLKSLEKLSGEKQYSIDHVLLETLENLSDAISNYIDNSTDEINELGDKKLIPAKDLECIHRGFTCVKCHKFLGISPMNVTRHLAVGHKTEKLPVQPKEKVEEKVQRKTRNNERKSAKKPEQPKLPKKAKALLCQKLTKLCKGQVKLAEKLKRLPEYVQIEDELKTIIQPCFPDKIIQLYKFGSRVCGIGNESSDLDIYADIGCNFENFENMPTEKTLNMANDVYKVIKKDKRWSNSIFIMNARVPIIKVVHKSTGISCDIGFSNSLGSCNTQLVEYLFDLQPIARKLCLVLKKWLERTKLNKNITTYSIVLMVIYYFQICEVFPSIESLQNELEKELLIGPWIGNFRRKSLEELKLQKVSENKAKLREYLYNFFAFYGDFAYKNWVICPYYGCMIESTELIQKMPARYQNFIKDNADGSAKLQLDTPSIIVQDPIQLNHNVTKNLSPGMFKIFVNYLNESAKELHQQWYAGDRRASICSESSTEA